MKPRFIGFKYRKNLEHDVLSSFLVLLKNRIQTYGAGPEIDDVSKMYLSRRFNVITIPLKNNKFIALAVHKYSDVLWEDGLVYPAIRLTNFSVGTSGNNVIADRVRNLEQVLVHGRLELTFASAEMEDVSTFFVDNLFSYKEPTHLFDRGDQDRYEIGYQWTRSGYEAYERAKHIKSFLGDAETDKLNYRIFDSRMKKISKEKHTKIAASLVDVQLSIQKLIDLASYEEFTEGCFYKFLVPLTSALSQARYYFEERHYQEYLTRDPNGDSDPMYKGSHTILWDGEFDENGWELVPKK